MLQTGFALGPYNSMAETSYMGWQGFGLAMMGTVFGMGMVLIVMMRRQHRHIRTLRAREEALQESEERYRQLVDMSPDAIYVHDGEHFVYINPVGATLLGATQPEALVGQSIWDVIHPDDLSTVKARAHIVSQARQRIEQIELQLLRLDGRTVHVESRATPVRYDGQPAVLAMLRDITERKRAEVALAKRAEELARTNAELEQFAYVASHELQEPLRKVVSFSELLTRHLANRLDAEADTYMGYIIDGATRMQGLVRDLLVYSRIGRNTGSLEPADADVLLKETLVELDAAVQQQRAEVTYDLLPRVMTQPVLMRQLLHNLIDNALKFNRAVPPRIHIAAALRDDAWLFTMRDNGIGIEAQYAERIFIMFQRLHARTEYPGTGIGLAICRKIVERHGGHIWVESEIGKGATFYFTIPAVLVQA